MALPTKRTQKEINHLKKKYLFYGQPKAGKTTFSSNFGDDQNKMLFFCTEPGHAFVEIYKYETNNGEQPTNWMHFIECCRELYDTEEHDFSMLVIDTVDILWQWCTEYVCQMNDVSHPSEAGFGKVYHAIASEFANVCNKLGQRGIGFIFITHKKEYTAQVGPREQTFVSTTLATGAQKFIHGFVDYIWFFDKDLETGERYILTDRDENINAGSRGDINAEPLPLKMPMNPEVVIDLLSKQ